MPRLVVIVPEELAPGYALAGTATVTARDAAEASAALADLLERRDAGILAVYEPFLVGLSPRVRARIASDVIPVVVALPTGKPGGEEARRARLSAVLRQAIGQRIGFRGGEP